ncbi:MAG: SUMF1/EgtB/PvdO family nonheme iron enzyme [Nitrospirota bacterium]
MEEHIPCYLVNPKDGTEMVLIPGGWFWMGSENDDSEAFANEKPRHLHYVEPFYFSITCITVEQFGRFVKESGYDAGKDWQKDPPDHPVRYVNWHDSQAYCKWAGLRLPTEAEWELTARGYQALKYPWGNNWEDGRRVCWDEQKGPKGSTSPVFDHPDGVSSFGTFQQSGNLWEWCEDGWDSNVYQRYAQGDFKIPKGVSHRVLRGGSWGNDDSRNLRGGNRYNYYPENRVNYIGFRCARDYS